LTPGESIVVLGTGGVGLSVIQGAAMVSAHPIVAFDRHQNRLDLARKLGATHAVHCGRDDLEPQVRRIVGEHGADVVVEHTGDIGFIRLAYELTQPQGRTLLVGVPHAGQSATIHTLPLHFGKVLSGSHGGSCRPERDIPRYLRLHEAGKLRLEELITDRFPLAAINDAIDGMRSGRFAGRCLIEVQSK
jgi:S-(hydroxymethyl)glutathione dehydrogenase/alcohol dehydrogenase